MQLFRRSKWARQIFDGFQTNLQAPIDRFIFITRNLKRVDLSDEIRVGVNQLFEICWRNLCAEEWHGQITATINKKNRKLALRCCQLKDIDAVRRQGFSELFMRYHAAEIVKVVTQLRRRARLPSNRENQLSRGRRLDNVIKCVVLKDHWRRLTSEKCFRKLTVFHTQPPQVDSQLRFHSDIDL